MSVGEARTRPLQAMHLLCLRESDRLEVCNFKVLFLQMQNISKLGKQVLLRVVFSEPQHKIDMLRHRSSPWV